jgi:hypothetical protein
MMFFIFTMSRRVLIFREGNNVMDYLHMSLCTADSASLPDGWSRCVQFSLTVVNQIKDEYNLTKGTLFSLFLVVVTNELPCMYVEKDNARIKTKEYCNL